MRRQRSGGGAMRRPGLSRGANSPALMHVHSMAGGCSVCGNNVVEAGEACDGPELKGDTCETVGFFAGVLRCGEGCLALDLAGCTNCGNNQVDGGELCDGHIGRVRAVPSWGIRPTRPRRAIGPAMGLIPRAAGCSRAVPIRPR